MKKLYSILGLFALVAMPTFAQEEDVTKYIQNPGFDEDLTWNTNGEPKEIIDKSTNLSSRSQLWVANDSSAYASTLTTGNGNWKRNDTDHSWNGFVAQIKGWEFVNDAQKLINDYRPYGTKAPEWVYFGTVPYGVGSTAIPIADDNNGSFLAMPEKPAEDAGDDNKGALYLRSGWGAQAAYRQTVKLPCAQYRLEYWVINLNYANSSSNTGVNNLCKVTCRKDVFEDTEGFNAQEWSKHTIEFTPTAEFTIQFGFQSSGGSASNPFLVIDGIKLYRIGDADENELLQADIMDYVDDINTYKEDSLADYSGISEEIGDIIAEYEDIAYSGDSEKMIKAYKDIQAYSATIREIYSSIEKIKAGIEKAAELLESETTYPGLDALSEELEKAQSLLESGTMADVKNGENIMNKAILAYYMSQEATPENPADFTFGIDNPTFVEQGKWYIGQGGGDQRLHTGLTDNEGNAMTAWNAWRNNLEVGNSVSISQDLTDLPAGKYTVTADLCTQNGCITDQHVFANGTIQSATSPVMTQTGWDPYTWETLTTATVIVTDGKLTIGVIGNGDGDIPSNYGGSDTDKRRGWFCVSNFKLNYLGAATEEEIAAATAARYTDAESLAESMHLAADKATFKAAIAEAKAANDFSALNEAQAIAEASENEYKAVMAGTYAELQEKIANDPDYTANAKKITQVPVDYMTNYLASAEATYTETSAITNVLRYYRDTLVPTLLNAESKEISDATGKQALVNTIADVVAGLGSYEADTEVIAESVYKLNEAISIAEKADIVYGDNADVTAYITNPTCDNVNGWTVNKPVGDGNGVKTSQQYDGNGAGGYIDTYNSEAGTLRATIYQVLDVPNGTYKIANIMRNSGENVYLFATDKAPITNEAGSLTLDPTATSVLAEAKLIPTPTKYYVVAEGEEANDKKTDSYGELWMAAADKVMAKFGISGVDNETGSSIYDLALEANNGSEDCPEGIDAADWAVFAANGGKGRGWFNNSVEIEVKNHVLVLGATCDYVFVNKTEEAAFTGTWFSADNFTLKMVKAGDNTGWNPATAIESVETSSVSSIYSISGTRVNALQKGINIVKMNGTVQKVLVK